MQRWLNETCIVAMTQILHCTERIYYYYYFQM